MTDTEILDWIQANVYDISITRDKKGEVYTVSFNTRVGCTCDTSGDTLREAVIKAKRYNGE